MNAHSCRGSGLSRVNPADAGGLMAGFMRMVPPVITVMPSRAAEGTVEELGPDPAGDAGGDPSDEMRDPFRSPGDDRLVDNM